MRKGLLVLICTAGLILFSLPTDQVEAGKTKSFSSGAKSITSGAKSFSSGGSTSGRSVSTGGARASKPPSGSLGGGTSVPRGKTYSSGPNKPSSPVSFSKSSSPVSSSTSRPPPPSKSTFASPVPKPSASAAPALPRGKSYSAGPSYSPSSPPFAPSSGGNTIRGRSHTASGTVAPAPPAARSQPSFDSLAAQEKMKADSRKAFVQAQQPKPTYADPQGKPRPMKPIERPAVESLRRDLDHERWVNRQERQRTVFGEYYSRPPVVIYQDPYSTPFWWWLLAQDRRTQAYWAYHHRDRLDAARYRELTARDSQLEAQIRQIEAQVSARRDFELAGLAMLQANPLAAAAWSSYYANPAPLRNPAYVPPALKDPDLMYTDGFVDAAYNPQPKQVTEAAPTFSTPPAHQPGGGASGLGILWRILLMLGVLGFLVWLVFFKRWGAT